MKPKPANDASATLSQQPESPWVTYLTGKKVSAETFLRGLEKNGTSSSDKTAGKPKLAGSVVVPDPAARSAFVDALAAKPERADRLVLLLRAAPSFGRTIRGIVEELVEASIRHLGIVTDPAPLQGTAYAEAVSVWLRSIRERPLPLPNVSTLFLLLLFGIQRKLLDPDAALALAAAATPRPRFQPTSAPHLLDLLLAAEPNASNLSAVVAYADASAAETKKLTTQTQYQAGELGRRADEVDGLNVIIDALRAENATLCTQREAAERRVAELERQIVDVRDGYRHQIYELRERIRGMLDGELTLWLQTAFDATQVDPPSVKAIEERLADALKLVERESQWLRPSA